MPFPPTPSNSPSNTPTPSITASVTPTLTPTGTPCPEVTPSNTPTISVTASNTPTISVTPSITASNTATPTNTPTISITPSNTATATPTSTVGVTPTSTSTPTSTIGLTPTPTQTQTLTPSPTTCNNVTAVFGYMEPCIGGTIDDHMGADVQVQSNVSVDTTFEVYVYYQNPGTSCNPATNLQQYFQVTIPAGSSTGNFNACSSGAYFPSGAVICDSCIISCDNPSICISASFLC